MRSRGASNGLLWLSFGAIALVCLALATPALSKPLGESFSYRSLSVTDHVLKGKAIANYAYLTEGSRHKTGDRWTKKRERRWKKHRDAIKTSPAHRQGLNRHLAKKRKGFRVWVAEQDPWEVAYARLSSSMKSALAGLSICESGNRNLSAGFFGWLFWHAIPSLGIPSWMIEQMASTPQGASYEQQAVITAAVTERYGFGGFPSCSRKLGLG